MRVTDRIFVQECLSRGIPVTDDDRREIASEVWPSLECWNQPALNRKIRQKLKQHDIRAALSEIYETVGKFTPAEAFSIQIAHMRKGHYPALRDYMLSAMPTPAKQVRVDSRSVNVHVNAGEVPIMRDGPPPTRARVIETRSSVRGAIDSKGGGHND